MLEEIQKETLFEATDANYMTPKADCFNEDGTIDKYKYLLQFPNFTKHERKMTKKKILKFLNAHARETYFRLEIQDSPFGCNFVFLGEGIHTVRQQEKFIAELWDCINSVLWEVKNFNFNSDDKESLEIWGVTEDGEPKILFLYPNSHGTIEIKDDEEC